MLHSVPSDSFCRRFSRLSPGGLPTASDNVEVLANGAPVGAVVILFIVNGTILGVVDYCDARLDMPNRESPALCLPQAPEPDLDEVVAHVDAPGLAKSSVVESIPFCQSMAGIAVHEAIVTEELGLGSTAPTKVSTHKMMHNMIVQRDAMLRFWCEIVKCPALISANLHDPI